MSVTTITGKNGFMAQQELKKRKDAFVAEFGDSGVVEIDAIDSDAERVRQANKLSPFVVKKSVGLVGKTSKPELKEITSLASNIDYDSKTQAG